MRHLFWAPWCTQRPSSSYRRTAPTAPTRDRRATYVTATVVEAFQRFRRAMQEHRAGNKTKRLQRAAHSKLTWGASLVNDAAADAPGDMLGPKTTSWAGLSGPEVKSRMRVCGPGPRVKMVRPQRRFLPDAVGSTSLKLWCAFEPVGLKALDEIGAFQAAGADGVDGVVVPIFVHDAQRLSRA